MAGYKSGLKIKSTMISKFKKDGMSDLDAEKLWKQHLAEIGRKGGLKRKDEYKRKG